MGKHRLHRESRLCYAVLIVLAVLCILPLMLVVSTSLTEERYVREFGYTLFPVKPSGETYKFLFMSRWKMLLRAYGITIATVVLGTLYSVTVTTCFAYAVTQKKSVFRFSRGLSFFAWFTTVFSGGLLPWYIMCTQYYGLKNNIFALFIPSGLSVWNMFILRGNFRQVPEELIEAAQLDGASHAQIFVRVSIPLARGGIVTVSLFNILGFWNDFSLPNYFISNTKLNTMTKMLYDMLNNVSALLNNKDLQRMLDKVVVPTTTARMAIVVLTILPIVLMYPFTLKYFVKGINVGGIKG